LWVIYFIGRKTKKNQIVIEVHGRGAWGAAVLRPYMNVVDGALVLRRKEGGLKPAPTRASAEGKRNDNGQTQKQT
jgi:hypothetical protein